MKGGFPPVEGRVLRRVPGEGAGACVSGPTLAYVLHPRMLPTLGTRNREEQMQDERNFGTGGDAFAGGSGNAPGSTGAGTDGPGGSTGGMGAAGGSTGTATGTADRLGGMGELKETLGNLESRADELMDRAADRLETAAERLDEMADRAPQNRVGARAGALGHSAADTLESVSRFLRDNDVAALQRDLGRMVAQRPLSVLLLAVGTGFVVGKVLR